MTRLLPVLLLFALALCAQNAITPGKFTVEHPTLLNLGFEWPITGDANRNATVDVRFRAVGESAWRPALPTQIKPMATTGPGFSLPWSTPPRWWSSPSSGGCGRGSCR